ncbi:MAG: HIT domain-containing protein [archaeon]|nr:HIT domain-containing protein [archaeon]MCR4323903.1 HIT domain-containing protein [Nanoarchaeota archaeon]
MEEPCELCLAIDEDYRVIERTDHSFCLIALSPIKAKHLLILPRRHVLDWKDLSMEESKDLFEMVSRYKDKILKISNEEPTLHMNFERHGTQRHIHCHLLPTKGGFRDLVSAHEGIPRWGVVSKEEMEKLRDEFSRDN